MHVGVIGQRAGPGMQHGKNAGRRSQVLGVGSHLRDTPCRQGHQQVIEHF